IAKGGVGRTWFLQSRFACSENRPRQRIRLIKPFDPPASLELMKTSSFIPTKIVPIVGSRTSRGRRPHGALRAAIEKSQKSLPEKFLYLFILLAREAAIGSGGAARSGRHLCLTALIQSWRDTTWKGSSLDAGNSR